MRRYKKKSREVQQTNQGPVLWPWSVLTSFALLQWLWAAGDIPWKDKAEAAAMAKRTRYAVLDYFLGGYCCEACRANGIWNSEKLEGHHVGEKKMYLSDYRHCMKQNFRREQLRNLIKEVKKRIRLLCKSCHEMAHHAAHQSVQRGMYVRLCALYAPVIHGQCTR